MNANQSKTSSEATLSAEEQAKVAALVAAAVKAAEEAARKAVEQMQDEVIAKAKKAGEEAAAKTADSVSASAERTTKVKKGAEIAYFVTGALFFIGSMVAGGTAAYKARKAGASVEGMAGATPGANGRGRNQ